VKKFLLMLLLIALAAGGFYLAGYWPERGRRLQAEQATAAAQAQLADAQARLRLLELADQVLAAAQHLSDKNYGLARDQASRFFDAARAELAQTQKPEARAALEAALRPRDALVAALTQGDPAAAGMLFGVLESLRQAAGRPPLPSLATGSLVPSTAASPPPSPSEPAPSPFAPSPMATFAPAPSPQP
jgi:hypothetical protein